MTLDEFKNLKPGDKVLYSNKTRKDKTVMTVAPMPEDLQIGDGPSYKYYLISDYDKEKDSYYVLYYDEDLTIEFYRKEIEEEITLISRTYKD